MKLFLLFFIFFLSLSSFVAGWILRGNYEQGAFHGFQQREKKATFQEDVPATVQNNRQQTEDLISSDENSSNSSIISTNNSSETETISSIEDNPTEENFKENNPSLSEESSHSSENNSSDTKPTTSNENNPKEKKDSSLSSEQSLSPVNNLEKPTTDESKPEIAQKASSTENSLIKKGVPQKNNDLSQKYKAFNQEGFIKTQGEQKYFSIDGQYSLLINVLSAEKSARDYIKSLKNRFPLWNFFIKPDSPQLRIYLGPFKTKSEALKFIENLPTPSPFPNYFMEEEGILP